MKCGRLIPLAVILCLRPAVEGANPPSVSRLLVDVVPALDPAGKPWRVLLLESKGGKLEMVSDEPSPAKRALELLPREGLSYVLRLRSSDGDIWMTDAEPFVAGKGQLSRTLEP